MPDSSDGRPVQVLRRITLHKTGLITPLALHPECQDYRPATAVT